MISSLVMTDFGLQVRRFASAEAARAAQAPIEGDGLGASLMPVVCAWCGAKMGAKVCAPHMACRVSHGICPACRAKHSSDKASRQATGPCPLGETGAAVPPSCRTSDGGHAAGRPAESETFWRLS